MTQATRLTQRSMVDCVCSGQSRSIAAGNSVHPRFTIRGPSHDTNQYKRTVAGCTKPIAGQQQRPSNSSDAIEHRSANQQRSGRPGRFDCQRSAPQRDHQPRQSDHQHASGQSDHQHGRQSLGQVSSLLNDIRGLVVEAANSGALSDEEIAANQLQIDSSLEAINRIAQTTTFQGRKLLDGSLDFVSTAGAVSSVRRRQDRPGQLGGDGPNRRRSRDQLGRDASGNHGRTIRFLCGRQQQPPINPTREPRL